jgi:hypothetical protein
MSEHTVVVHCVFMCVKKKNIGGGRDGPLLSTQGEQTGGYFG